MPSSPPMGNCMQYVCVQCNSQTSLNKIHFLNTLYHFCLNTISWFSVTWYDVRCECLDFWFVYLDRYVAFITDFRMGSLFCTWSFTQILTLIEIILELVSGNAFFNHCPAYESESPFSLLSVLHAPLLIWNRRFYAQLSLFST